MQLFVHQSVRRIVGLLFLLFVSIPFGLSVTGCGHHAATPVFCNGGDTGLQVGQLQTISLSPALAITGESVNYGQMGQTLNASGQDCKGASVSLGSIVYATTDMSIADVNPNTGQVCGGTWNRNTGGGVADFTVCNPPAAADRSKYLAYITATANGITSNVVPVYVHPIVTSIVFGKPGGVSACSTDPDTTCCPTSPSTVITAPYYAGTSCVSQNHTAQIAARVYANGTTNPADNITCRSGHVLWGTEGGSGIVTLDPNGVATAGQPGSVSITAALSQSGSASSIGYFATCPPASITLSAVGQGNATSINVGLNNTQPFTASVLDTNGNALTGVSLEFESTTPQTIPASGASATPIFPGTATITALCQPPSCNPAPYSQIGYLGNGKPVTSNGIQITTAGTSSTVIIVGSTHSQYVYPLDLSTGLTGALLKLPFVPNSMVISQDGSTVYMGSSQGLMTMSTLSNAVAVVSTAIQGKVISVSPDGSTVVVTDPTRNTISLVNGSAVGTSYDGVATHAQWSPDSQTVYITTAPGSSTGAFLLTHSAYTNWQPTSISGTGSADSSYNDVTVMVPSVGAYFAGAPNTDGRSYCPKTSIATPGTPPITSNVFTPLADSKTVATDHVAATTDGKHILGASVVAGMSDIYINSAPGNCTTIPTSPTFGTTLAATIPFATAGVVPSTINSIVPSSNSALAFVTFNGTGGKLPYYIPSSTGAAGTLTSAQLATTSAGTPTAPVSGVFSSDNSTFFTGTAGDNLVHFITVTYGSGAPTVRDSSQIAPNLPDASGSGNTATPDLIVQKPRKVTS